MYICIHPAGPMSVAGLRSGEVIGPQPSESRVICLTYFSEKESTQWVIWGIGN